MPARRPPKLSGIRRKRHRFTALLALLSLLLLAGCGIGNAASSTQSQPPTPTVGLSPTAVPTPVSWLRSSTLLTIYGRGFGIVPVLGRLGYDNSFADMQRQIQPFYSGIRTHNGGKRVLVGVHLIYAIATGCGPRDNCLGYLDDSGVNIVRDYIQPAAQRGWLVILDDQLGLSNPVSEVQHIIARGYLRYDNVELALDPEFRTRPGQVTPGIPVGSVDASEINHAQAIVDAYARRMHLRHHKILIIHQFEPGMVTNRDSLSHAYSMVDLTLTADGFGTPEIKAHVYSDMLAVPVSRNILWRGIKLFYPNPEEHAGHGDNPLMTWDEVFGKTPLYDQGHRYFVRPPPDVVIIA